MSSAVIALVNAAAEDVSPAAGDSPLGPGVNGWVTVRSGPPEARSSWRQITALEFLQLRQDNPTGYGRGYCGCGCGARPRSPTVTLQPVYPGRNRSTVYRWRTVAPQSPSEASTSALKFISIARL